MTTYTRAALLMTAPLALALALAGCSGAAGTGDMPGMHHGSATPSASAADVAMADQMFATMMIPHHEQAIEMADILLAKEGVDPRVVAIAERIETAQGPEIQLMRGWLEDWGVDEGSGVMDHGDGMMTEADMTALRDADGATAGRLFLEQMVVHHQGAVEMAEAALAAAEDPDVRALAEQVIEDQNAEIAEMQQLAATL